MLLLWPPRLRVQVMICCIFGPWGGVGGGTPTLAAYGVGCWDSAQNTSEVPGRLRAVTGRVTRSNKDSELGLLFGELLLMGDVV